MKITRKEVDHVAHLARLEISGEEVDVLTDQMNDILEYIGKLNELDTDEVEPTCHAVEVTNAFREDVRRKRFTVGDALANAPDSDDGNFKVPKVIE